MSHNEPVVFLMLWIACTFIATSGGIAYTIEAANITNCTFFDVPCAQLNPVLSKHKLSFGIID